MLSINNILWLKNMRSFEQLFPSKSFVDILCLFVMHPQEEFYQTFISKFTGYAIVQVQRALKRLEAAELVSKHKSGNRVYYKTNREHPAFEDIKQALLKTILFGEKLKEALKPIENKIIFSFIYGSIAKGTDSKASDVDLFIIGDVKLRDISVSLGSLRGEIGREINISAYSKKQFLKKKEEGNNFISEVIASPKIWLLGEKNEFEKMG